MPATPVTVPAIAISCIPRKMPGANTTAPPSHANPTTARRAGMRMPSAEAHVREIDDELRLPVAAHDQPRERQRDQQPDRVPERAPGQETTGARGGCAGAVGWCFVGRNH